MNSDRNRRTTDNVCDKDEDKLALVKTIFVQIVEAPIRRPPVAHTSVQNATEPQIEWYFTISSWYQTVCKSTPMIIFKLKHELSVILRLDINYFQSNRSWILGVGTLQSARSLERQPAILAEPMSERFQRCSSDQDKLFPWNFQSYETVIFHIQRLEHWASKHRSAPRDSPQSLWKPTMFASTICTKMGFTKMSLSSSLSQGFP